MGLTELTPAQHATVDALVVARRIERVPIDANRCTSFLEQMRRERNAQRYHATPHTEASAQVASDAAKILVAVGEQQAGLSPLAQ